MYESFYQLREKPFSLLPDPGFLYLSKKHGMALTMLEYGLTNNAGFSVICGEVGSGKTTLIRHLLNNVAQGMNIGLITNTHRSFGELLNWILWAFDIDHKDKDKAELYQTFVDFLIREYAKKRRTVLIIDEAQNMSPDTLEELRMLSNVNVEKYQVLQVILVGQPELRDTLRLPELRQFAQRVAVDYYLKFLNERETRDYIRHRLEVAGGDPNLFTEDACALVYRHSEGTPRIINTLCDMALVYAFAEEKPRVDAETIEEVLRDRAENGIFGPAETASAAAPDTADIEFPADEPEHDVPAAHGGATETKSPAKIRGIRTDAMLNSYYDALINGDER